MITPAHLTRLVLAAAVAVWIANAGIIVAASYPLGHDEAQYAIAGRALVSGAAPRADWFYISTGMAVVAAPGTVAGGSELALRLVPMGFGFGFLAAIWLLARRAFGSVTAAWTIAVIAGSRSFVRFSAELLSDMPAAACLIAACAVIVDELARDAPRWRIALAAPLLAGAFYLRYASVVPIAMLVVTALALGARPIARRPAPVLVTAALFAALLAPHLWSAILQTGSPLGILLESQSVPPRGSAVQGLVGYLTANPLVFYGVASTPVMIVGVLAGVLAGPRGLVRDRRAALVWLLAVGDVVALGLLTDAQVRYIFLGTALLVIVGTEVIRRGITRLAPTARAWVTGAALAGLVAAWLVVTLRTPSQGDSRLRSDGGTLIAGAAVRADARGRACYVLGARAAQLEWYTGCRGSAYDISAVLGRRDPLYAVTDPRHPWSFDARQLPGRRITVIDVPAIVEVVQIEVPRP
jgi:4-amino-4-deoxy-L-arabinose transferase-like glycosyltransferase